jgi:hypothetical protein
MNKNISQSKEWEPIELKYLGKVDEIILFPGTGKLSLPYDDMGDAPKKPKGLE